MATATMPTIEKSIGIREASEILGIHPNTCQKLVAEGKLPGHKIGRLWRFLPSMLDEWRREQIRCGCHSLSASNTEEK